MTTQKENVQELENRRLQKEIEQLKADMNALRGDILALTRALGETAAEYGGQAGDEVSRKVEQARAQAAEQLRKAQQASRQAMEEMEAKIVERPFASLFTAAAVGFMVARLLDLGGRR